MKFNNIVKIIILVLIIIFCLYILYFSSFSIEEGLTNIDCSKCIVKPSLGNCIPIKDLSYSNFGENIQNINFDVIDTSYVFCPWTPDCHNLDNIMSQTKRQNLSNSNIQSGIKNNVQCCPDVSFYAANTTNINKLPQFQDIKNMCSRINNSNNLINIANRVGNDYLELQNLCNQVDLSGLYFNRDISFSGNILKDPNLSVQEIIDYQNILEVKLVNNSGGQIQRIQDLNNELRRLDLNKRSDRDRKKLIQNNLANNFFISTISYDIFQYTLLKEDGMPALNTVGSSYILQENEFFNCFGNKEKVKTFEDISFSAQQLLEFSNNNFFDVASDACYNTIQDNVMRPYPSAEDFEMELKNLPPIQQSSNVSSSVITSYLNTINSFYQKQLNALIGPRTHAVPQTIKFDNDSLSTKPSTFFVYDGSINNNFDCEPSVTGDDKFKYCGPASYYSEFKP